MDIGGIENQLMHLLRQADKDKFQIDFTTTIDHPFYVEVPQKKYKWIAAIGKCCS